MNTKDNRTLVLLCFAGLITLLGIGYAITSTIRSEAKQTRDSMETLAKKPAAEIAKTAASTFEQMGATADELFGGSMRDEGESKKNGASNATKSDVNSQTTPFSKGVLISDLFKAGRDTARGIDNSVQDALQLDNATKKRIGLELHQRIIIQNGALNDPQVKTKLEKIAKPFLKHSGLKNSDIKFTVLESPEVNAFAHIGGYVYLNKGLMNIQDDDELQFVVGHEIGHIALGHCSKKLTYAVRAAEVAGNLGATFASVAYDAIAIGYSQEDEFEADLFSYNQLDKNKSAAIRSLEKIANAMGDTTEVNQSNSPVTATFNAIDMHFQSHPPTKLRIERLRNQK